MKNGEGGEKRRGEKKKRITIEKLKTRTCLLQQR